MSGQPADRHSGRLAQLVRQNAAPRGLRAPRSSARRDAGRQIRGRFSAPRHVPRDAALHRVQAEQPPPVGHIHHSSSSATPVQRRQRPRPHQRSLVGDRSSLSARGLVQLRGGHATPVRRVRSQHELSLLNVFIVVANECQRARAKLAAARGRLQWPLERSWLPSGARARAAWRHQPAHEPLPHEYATRRGLQGNAGRSEHEHRVHEQHRPACRQRRSLLARLCRQSRAEQVAGKHRARQEPRVLSQSLSLPFQVQAQRSSQQRRDQRSARRVHVRLVCRLRSCGQRPQERMLALVRASAARLVWHTSGKVGRHWLSKREERRCRAPAGERRDARGAHTRYAQVALLSLHPQVDGQLQLASSQRAHTSEHTQARVVQSYQLAEQEQLV